VRLLLDTHAFLWWITDDPRLSEEARRRIADPQDEVLLSAVSAWELAIKAGLGRLALPTGADLEDVVRRQVEVNRLEVLPVQLSHALRVGRLPPHHRDPFDRLLVAQALVEGVPLVSADPALAPYPVEILW
jgi:PIN domain nuclease of toxin-antitoxin system